MDEPQRWLAWWRVLDCLHEQGRLPPLATPAGAKFVAALDAAIQHDLAAGLVNAGEQFSLLTKLRDFTSPGLEKTHARLRENAKKGGASRSKWTDDERLMVAQAVAQILAAHPKVSVSNAATRVLTAIEAGRLSGVRRLDPDTGRTLGRRSVERWYSRMRKV
ncbi:hypothetical protein [Caballeronia choica]|uniref:hypothetical protein n=1 Tax=Caballeronia choica TaxID=326476 RepID=UPI000F73C5FB|nr:hypothetical protein [Caballeronia choica]